MRDSATARMIEDGMIVKMQLRDARKLTFSDDVKTVWEVGFCPRTTHKREDRPGYCDDCYVTIRRYQDDTPWLLLHYRGNIAGFRAYLRGVDAS